jgi:hypothetical protein
VAAEGRHHLCAEIDSAAIVAAAGGGCCSYTIICTCFENAIIVIDSNFINCGSGIGSRGRLWGASVKAVHTAITERA